MTLTVKQPGWRRYIWMGLLVLGLWLGSGEGAIAALHTYPEPSGSVMYRSLQTLRDTQGQAWQTVFYKRIDHGLVTGVSLRLVGFPGGVELAHPQSLRLSDRQGKTWTATDAFATAKLDPALAPTVGEYDGWPVVEAIAQNRPLWLSLPLAEGGDRTLAVPPFAIREWQQLMDADGLMD